MILLETKENELNNLFVFEQPVVHTQYTQILLVLNTRLFFEATIDCFITLFMLFSANEARDWENPRLLQRNTQLPHASFIPFNDIEAARVMSRGDSPCFLTLNGDWKFHWSPNPEVSPSEFFRSDFDDSAWEEFPVPANWEINERRRYGTPIYASSGYVFKIAPPLVTQEPPADWTSFEERNPVGCYRREFQLPEDWQGSRVFLHFAGVTSAFYVWINGREVGYSQGSREPSEWEITPFLKAGQNSVAVQVFKYCDGSYLEDQDMWRMGGIFREVFLFATPALRIRDFAVRTLLDDDFANATLQIEPKLDVVGENIGKGWQLEAQLFDAAGEAIFSEPLSHEAAPILNGEFSPAILNERTPQRGMAPFGWLSGSVENPALWSAEAPNLYRLVLSLHDENGNCIQAVSCDVGFRRVEIKEGGFHINGVPVRLRGVNRHEIDPDFGQVVSEERMVQDIVLMKRANVNAVRAAHYPHSPRWYELCDRYGLYVMDEADIETHGLRGALAQDPTWTAAFLDRAIRMAERDKNHPCVVIWSMGNESGFGPNFSAIAGWLHEFDPTRPVHYEGAQNHPSDPSCVDFVSRFYPRLQDEYLNPRLAGDTQDAPERAENARWERLSTLAEQEQSNRPVLTSEYAHAMGNALGNFQEYWDEIYAHPRLMGGFIWEWCDHGLRHLSEDGTPFLAYGGDFGDTPNLGAFCLDGVITSDREITSKWREVQKVYQPIKIAAFPRRNGPFRLEITNRHHFTDLREFEGRWSLTQDGVEIQQGFLPVFSLPAGEVTEIEVPHQPLEGVGEFHIRASFHLREATDWAPSGYEIAWQQLEVAVVPSNLPSAKSSNELLSVETIGNGSIVAGSSFTALFDSEVGNLTSLQLGGHEILASGGGPILQAFRAPTDNDRGFGKWLARDWREAGLEQLERALESFEVNHLVSGEVQVSSVARYTCAGAQFRHFMDWVVRGNGDIECRNRFVIEGDCPPLPRIGILWRLRGELNQFEWFGHGPHENYSDRKASAALGVWKGSVEEQFVSYARPQENGNKEGVRWLSLTDTEGHGLCIESLTTTFSASALPFSAQELANARHPHELKPSGDVFLSLDAAQCGLGNSSCGPGVLQKYARCEREYRLDFVLRRK